jgi:hypothetical protein
MAEFAGMKDLDVWYSRLDIESVLQDYGSQFKPKLVKRAEKTLANARTKDSMTAFAKLTHVVDGKVQIVDQSPLIVPIEQLAQGQERERLFDELHQLLRGYRDTLEFDRRVLLEQFDLLCSQSGRGRERRHARLDCAAARPRQPGPAVPADQGSRSIGTGRVPRTERVSKPRRGPGRHGHVRQAVRLDARPHARSGDRIAIAAYLGNGDSFDRAIVEFSKTYADQNERDYHELAAAVKSGTITAEAGL